MTNRLKSGVRAVAPALVVATVLAMPGTASADRYKDCSTTAEKNLGKAVSYINQNMSTLVDQYTFLSEKQRQEIVRKWPKVKIRCNDDSHRCRGKNGTGIKGHAHGGLGNTINVCEANMVDEGISVCGAVGIIMHETGHAHGFRMAAGHNAVPLSDYVKKHDVIYRMGNIAATHCSSTIASNDTFTGTKRAGLGDGCRNNDDCSSGRCWVKIDSRPFEVTPPGQNRGTCVCNDDGDCPDGQQCYEPFGKQHYCSSTTKKLGDDCKKNSQCASNKCERGECVCRTDNDCGGRKCRTPITGKNYCD